MIILRQAISKCGQYCNHRRIQGNNNIVILSLFIFSINIITPSQSFAEPGFDFRINMFNHGEVPFNKIDNKDIEERLLSKRALPGNKYIDLSSSTDLNKVAELKNYKFHYRIANCKFMKGNKFDLIGGESSYGGIVIYNGTYEEEESVKYIYRIDFPKKFSELKNKEDMEWAKMADKKDGFCVQLYSSGLRNIFHIYKSNIIKIIDDDIINY